MPQMWQMVDTNFPTITGDEPIPEQISKIIDYLAILTEQLQFQLNNLDSSNWNVAALESFTDDTTTQFGEKVAALSKQASALQIAVSNLSARVLAIENLSGRVTYAEDNIGKLQGRMIEAETNVGLLENALDGEGGIKERLSETEQEIGNAQEDIDGISQQLDGEGGIKERLSKVEELLGLSQEEGDETQ